MDTRIIPIVMCLGCAALFGAKTDKDLPAMAEVPEVAVELGEPVSADDVMLSLAKEVAQIQEVIADQTGPSPAPPEVAVTDRDSCSVCREITTWQFKDDDWYCTSCGRMHVPLKGGVAQAARPLTKGPVRKCVRGAQAARPLAKGPVRKCVRRAGRAVKAVGRGARVVLPPYGRR